MASDYERLCDALVAGDPVGQCPVCGLRLFVKTVIGDEVATFIYKDNVLVDITRTEPTTIHATFVCPSGCVVRIGP